MDPDGRNPLVVPYVAAQVCARAPQVCAAVVGGAVWLSAKVGETVVSACGKLHKNSYYSQCGTELYYLINRNSGAIDKIGVTSNPEDRYSQSFLDSEGVDYVRQRCYETRYPALVDENIQLVSYFNEHGALPRLNNVFR